MSGTPAEGVGDIDARPECLSHYTCFGPTTLLDDVDRRVGVLGGERNGGLADGWHGLV